MAFNLKTAIGSIAPTLATMLGGPLAGTAITALEGVFGLSPSSGGTDGVTAAVAAGMTPQNIQDIRAADQKHLEVMQQQGIDLDKMNLDFQAAQEAAATADRASARGMQIANHSWMPAILTTVLTLGFFAVLLAKLWKVFPNGDDPIVNQMIGTLLAVWTASVAYWVGTTRNSFDKTQLLAQSTPPGLPATPTAAVL
jgi:hypothetical protein